MFIIYISLGCFEVEFHFSGMRVKTLGSKIDAIGVVKELMAMTLLELALYCLDGGICSMKVYKDKCFLKVNMKMLE